MGTGQLGWAAPTTAGRQRRRSRHLRRRLGAAAWGARGPRRTGVDARPTDVSIASDDAASPGATALSIPGLVGVIAPAAVTAAWSRARSA